MNEDLVWTRLLLPIAVYGVILALSSVPADRLDGFGLPAFVDVLGHAIEYAILGATLRWSLEGSRWPMAATIVVGAVLGAVDELYQATLPGRDPALGDWVIDLVAVVVAALLVRARLRRAG